MADTRTPTPVTHRGIDSVGSGQDVRGGIAYVGDSCFGELWMAITHHACGGDVIRAHEEDLCSSGIGPVKVRTTMDGVYDLAARNLVDHVKAKEAVALM